MIKNMKALDDAALEKISGATISDEALDSIECHDRFQARGSYARRTETGAS
ncbi:MAG: hypothetical protein VZR26_10650 [Erysipelotrichaceae bacterium]|nr:hypothetical protein [Erysipelotrichaceae bacterium]